MILDLHVNRRLNIQVGEGFGDEKLESATSVRSILVHVGARGDANPSVYEMTRRTSELGATDEESVRRGDPEFDDTAVPPPVQDFGEFVVTKRAGRDKSFDDLEFDGGTQQFAAAERSTESTSRFGRRARSVEAQLRTAYVASPALKCLMIVSDALEKLDIVPSHSGLRVTAGEIWEKPVDDWERPVDDQSGVLIASQDGPPPVHSALLVTPSAFVQLVYHEVEDLDSFVENVRSVSLEVG